jgi:hypothetical protein
MWRCKCDCGNEIDVYASQLKNGSKCSCGCIKEEKRKSLAEEKEKQKEAARAIKHALREEKKKKQEVANVKPKSWKRKSESLASKYPSIASDWDYKKNKDLSPNDVSSASTKKVWWICPNGHSYLASIGNRTSNKGQGCPYCSTPAKKVLKGYNDLKTKYPALAKEWHPTKNGTLKPDSVLCGSAKKVWWICPNGHEYEQGIASRVKGGSCPYCSHQRILVGYSDLATTHPYLLSEWDFEKNSILPTEIGAGSELKIWWKCPFGHSYQARPYSRTGSSHTGCPICNKENHTSFPEQALFFYIKKAFPDAINSDNSTIGMELDVFIPSLRIAIEYDGLNWHKSNKYEIKKNEACLRTGIRLFRIREIGLDLYDNCTCLVREDLRSSSSLSDVIRRTILSIDNSIDEDIDVERDSIEIYESYIKTRKSHNLLKSFPEIASEWHPTKNGKLTAEMVAPATQKKVWWLGKCGHEWQMAVQSRTIQNSGCPICSGKRIVSGVNDLLTKYPEICKEWYYEKNDRLGIYPNKVAPHSDKKVWWKCKVCGNVWEGKIDGRTRMNAGCPNCGIRHASEAKYKPVRCIETGVIYNSLKKAEEKTGIHRNSISNCCKGKQKKAGNLHWEFV